MSAKKRAPVGLFDLLAAARERLGGMDLVSFYIHYDSVQLEDVVQVAEKLADAVLARAWHGSFFKAGTTGFPWSEWAPEPWPEWFEGLEDCPAWEEFAAVCAVVVRIDDFLAAYERARGSAPLARGCRADLDALVVLADWCEENGLPMAAREARHLHGEVRYLRRELFSGPFL